VDKIALEDLPKESIASVQTVEWWPILSACEGILETVDPDSSHGRIRRRDGARSWGLFRDMENADRYVETFIVASWTEHLRQHERLTLADREAEERVQRYVRSESKVRHLISVARR
jgi:hypothetical protein